MLTDTRSLAVQSAQDMFSSTSKCIRSGLMAMRETKWAGRGGGIGDARDEMGRQRGWHWRCDIRNGPAEGVALAPPCEKDPRTHTHGLPQTKKRGLPHRRSHSSEPRCTRLPSTPGCQPELQTTRATGLSQAAGRGVRFANAVE